MKTVLKENHVYIEEVRSFSSQFSFTVVMMNMKLISVVTPQYIHHGCYNPKMFWEERFTGKEIVFLAVNMKNVVVTMLGNTKISRLVTRMSPLKSH